MFKNLPPSQEIIYYCGRCKLELNHRVTLKTGSHIERVLCLTCQTERAYHAPAKAKPEREAKAKAAPRARAAASASESLLRLRDMRLRAAPYRIDQRYGLEDLIEHVSFGRGVVLELIEPDKMRVLFEAGEKVLKCARAS